jgi:predicted GNAT family acetyltransferase
VRVTRTRDVAAFAATTGEWLQRDPYRNNVVASVIRSRAQRGYPVEPAALWLTVHDGSEIAGVALVTPPRGALLSQMAPAAAAALGTWFAENTGDNAADHAPPTVDSLTAVALSFRDAYVKRSGATATQQRLSRLYALERVRPPVAVNGLARPAAAGDRDRLIAWLRLFQVELNIAEDSEVVIDQRLRGDQLIWLWEVDGRPASMTLLSEPIVGVSRVGGVFTPVELRGHGYASAVVAAASQHALDHGSTACMLYTDLANPTSNKIYQQVGYEPVDDAEVWAFS